MSSHKGWPEGSFGHYMYRSGDFVKTVAVAIQRAEPLMSGSGVMDAEKQGERAAVGRRW